VVGVLLPPLSAFIALSGFLLNIMIKIRPIFRNLLCFCLALLLAQTPSNASAKPGYDTPAGRFVVLRTLLDPYWRNPWTNELFAPFSREPGNPMGAAAITISSGVALHGTNEPSSIGTRASHGCIRHQNRDILRIIQMVIPGTAVYVFNQVDESALSLRQLAVADFDWENSQIFKRLNDNVSDRDAPATLNSQDSGAVDVD
jgi:hypothetical protein